MQYAQNQVFWRKNTKYESVIIDTRSKYLVQDERQQFIAHEIKHIYVLYLMFILLEDVERAGRTYKSHLAINCWRSSIRRQSFGAMPNGVIVFVQLVERKKVCVLNGLAPKGTKLLAKLIST